MGREEGGREPRGLARAAERAEGEDPLGGRVLGERPPGETTVVLVEEPERAAAVAATEGGPGVAEDRDLGVERRRGGRGRGRGGSQRGAYGGG